MRIFYAIYAVVIILLLWNSNGDTTVKNLALKAILALWCAGLLSVSLKVRGSEWVALAGFVPLIGFLLFQTGTRLNFILEHGGMDCPSCNASPMAFVLGWITELSLLVPGVVLCLWLIRRARSKTVAREI